ncbi:MAG TPA: hypothetical protein VM221_03025 [Armatimonadota bacterium]|nr:hypothetical protein [Armatimonadota bacterium]
MKTVTIIVLSLLLMPLLCAASAFAAAAPEPLPDMRIPTAELQGRAAFARYLLCVDANGNPQYQPYNNFGWLDPEFGGWQERYKRVATEPFHITGQTPTPDPAHYER